MILLQGNLKEEEVRSCKEVLLEMCDIAVIVGQEIHCT